jgi:ABC-type phosphate transport system permease subunit
MGLMILPLVSSLSEDAMRAVPTGLREGSYALGATRMQTALKVVVPAAFSGITAAFILAASRAIGETMIVAIAAGQQPRLTGNPFVPIETMTAYIVQVSLGDTPQGTIEYRTIFAVGMLLFLMTFGLNLVSTWLRERSARNAHEEAGRSPLPDWCRLRHWWSLGALWRSSTTCWPTARRDSAGSSSPTSRRATPPRQACITR